jgi:hypothetical protein
MFGRENETHRIKDMISYIGSNDLQNIGRMRSEDFTRNCILTIPIMIFIALNKQSKTLNMELYNFSEKIGFNEIGKRITKHSYSIARKKLNPRVFKALNNRYLSKLYKHKGTYKTFKGYVLIAGDASKVILPNIKSLREIYGGKKCDDGILRSYKCPCEHVYMTV